MGWVSFMDPFLFEDARINKRTVESAHLGIPNINKGSVVEIIDDITIKVAAIESRNMFSVECFILELRDINKTSISDVNNDHWQKYNIIHYLKTNLLNKTVLIRNLTVSRRGVLKGDVYLGKMHINKIVVDIGLATEKRVKFSGV